MAVDLASWLDVIGREYLTSFVPEGGGAVRFAVAEADTLARVGEGLRRRAEAGGLHVVTLDVAATRLHMLQTVVFALAASLPWDRLLQARLEAMVATTGYAWPRPGQPVLLPELAEANGVATHLLRRELMQALSREVWEEPRLTLDFRYAMIALLDARLSGEAAGLSDAVMSWLQGTLRTLGQVKQAQIGRRIGRQNARAVLMSLCHWVRLCGGAGSLLLIDIRQLHRDRRAVTEGLVYTPAAVMDCYEVLRQLIDDIEHFPGLFVAALADDAFLSDDPKRSLSQYTALQMRIWDDVRPQGGDNPLAPLVRIAA